MGKRKSRIKKQEGSAGLEQEIQALRTLLEESMERKNSCLSFDEQLNLLETFGRASSDLAHLIKAKHDLDKDDMSPGETLRQALLELEKEWPELQKFCEQFKPKKENPST